MKYLLFDADETLWNFKATEEIALRKLFPIYNMEYDDKTVDDYEVGNRLCWKEYEGGTLALDELETKRWDLFFKRRSVDHSSLEAALLFRNLLAHNGILLDGADVFLESIKEYPKSLVTNGIAMIQRMRLKDTGIEKYFDNIFISSEIGYHKPQKELFDFIVKKLGKKKDECIMIGDSEHSDIMGAVNAGMESIYISFKGEKSSIATYSVSSYGELEDLIRSI